MLTLLGRAHIGSSSKKSLAKVGKILTSNSVMYNSMACAMQEAMLDDLNVDDRQALKIY